MTTLWLDGRDGPITADEAPAQRRLALSFRSGSREEADQQPARASLPMLYSAGAMREFAAERARATQAKQLQHAPPSDSRGTSGKWLEPPFPVDELTTLLYDAPDFFAICDRIAIDVAGAFDLVDAEEVATGESQIEGDVGTGATNVPERGDVDRRADADDLAVAERKRGDALLEDLARDFANRPITVTQLCRCVEMDKDAVGQGLIEVGRDPQTGLPVHGAHLPARLMRIEKNGRTWVQLNDQGQAVAFFREFGSNPDDPTSRMTQDEASRSRTQKTAGALKNEVWVVKHHHPAELHYGVPPIIPALVALKGNLQAEARNLRYFLNRAMPDYLIQMQADASALAAEDEADMAGAGQVLGKVEDKIEELLTAVARGDDYKTGFLRVPRDQCEMKFEKLGVSINDAEFLEYTRQNRDTQLRAYGVPPHRIGIIETASLGTGTGETQEETYKRSVIEPRQLDLEAFFNLILDEHELFAVRFKFREVDVVDEEREMVMYATAVSSQAMTLNEGRAWLSRLVHDQDFPPYNEDENVSDDPADVPMLLLQGAAPPGGAGGASPFGAPGGAPFGQGGPNLTPGIVPQGGSPPATQPAPVTERQLALDPRWAALTRHIANRTAERLQAFQARRASADRERAAARTARGNGSGGQVATE
jgi:capsid portal protein